jgi:hypothetical protein
MCAMSFHQLHCISSYGIKLDATFFIQSRPKKDQKLRLGKSITARDDAASK